MTLQQHHPSARLLFACDVQFPAVGKRLHNALTDCLSRRTLTVWLVLQLLGALRDIKQHLADYSMKCVIAVGPFSILFMKGESGSPFNVREAVPVHFFSVGQVSELLQQFAAAQGVVLEEGIAADVHELTAGHAGLVCGCGRALESAVRREGGVISLAAWRDFRVTRIVEQVLGWPTMRKLAESVASMPANPRSFLELVLTTGDASTHFVDRDAEMARYLAAEGWLAAVGPATDNNFRMTSPLARYIAMQQLASTQLHITAPLPLNSADVLIFSNVIPTALGFCSGQVMRDAVTVSSKRSKASAAPTGMAVPNEATYHFQLFAVLRAWLTHWRHAFVFPEADACVSATGSSNQLRKKYADILLVGRTPGSPKHIVELVASADDADVREHYSRTLAYMAAHAGARGTCITFTAVRTAAEVDAVNAASLAWPADKQRAIGLEAMHVIHDLGWTTAAVHSSSPDGTLSCQKVTLHN